MHAEKMGWQTQGNLISGIQLSRTSKHLYDLAYGLHDVIISFSNLKQI